MLLTLRNTEEQVTTLITFERYSLCAKKISVSILSLAATVNVVSPQSAVTFFVFSNNQEKEEFWKD